MDFDLSWLLWGLPIAFGLGWLASRLDSSGTLRVVAADTRSQSQNRALAIERLAALVLDYLSRNGLEVHCESDGEAAVERTGVGLALAPNTLTVEGLVAAVATAAGAVEAGACAVACEAKGATAAKAAVENFTRWLAVDLGKRTKGGVRVNALVPGFFLGEQNRRLLTNEDGSLTERGETICRQTPFGRFGQAEELFGAIHYLVSDASKFVTGTTLVCDGGDTIFANMFAAYDALPDDLKQQIEGRTALNVYDYVNAATVRGSTPGET